AARFVVEAGEEDAQRVAPAGERIHALAGGAARLVGTTVCIGRAGGDAHAGLVGAVPGEGRGAGHCGSGCDAVRTNARLGGARAVRWEATRGAVDDGRVVRAAGAGLERRIAVRVRVAVTGQARERGLGSD